MDHRATLANLGALNPYAYVYSVFTLALRSKSLRDLYSVYPPKEYYDLEPAEQC
jgi:hypothetical protein